MIDFGIGLPAGPQKGQTAAWLTDLEQSLPLLGNDFRSLWMTDHFFWEDKPTYEAWTVLSYIAARWPQFEVGPMVLGQSYRNPALLAKMGATLQALSGGRFIMGVGAGWKEDEYIAYDYPYPRPGIRVEQLEDTLNILRVLWQQPGKVTYEGRHYRVTEAFCEPKPEPVPPIMVGGKGTKTMLLAAKYADWWNASDANYALYSSLVNTLREHCATIGRDPATMRVTWFGRLAVDQSETKALALGGNQWTRDNAFVGTPEQILEQIAPFVSLGCDYFMFDILGLPNADRAAIVTEEVLPKIRQLAG